MHISRIETFTGVPFSDQIVGIGFKSTTETSRGVVQVTKHTSHDSSGKSTIGTAQDGRMGAISSNAQCDTCGKNALTCYGHSGEIELPIHLPKMAMMKHLINVMLCVCINCGGMPNQDKWLSKVEGMSALRAVTKVIKESRSTSADPNKAQRCDLCGQSGLRKFTNHPKHRLLLVVENQYFPCTTVFMLLSKLVETDVIKNLGWSSSLSPYTFMQKRLITTPNRHRINTKISGVSQLHVETQQYSHIVRECDKLKDMTNDLWVAKNIKQTGKQLHSTWGQPYLDLSVYISDLIMKRKVEGNQRFVTEDKTAALLNQNMSKTGIPRTNIVSYRTDNSGRGVIIPITKSVDTITIPSYMAKNCCKIVKVVRLNYDHVYNMKANRKTGPVIRGYIRAGSDYKELSEEDLETYVPLLGDIIVRDLSSAIHNGGLQDRAVIVRSPVLKPTNTQNKVVIVSDDSTNYAIGLHTTGVGGYNADFDGDQMAIFPSQGPMAAIDMMFAGNTQSQSIEMATLTNVNGCIQDSITGAAKMSQATFVMFPSERDKLMISTYDLPRMIEISESPQRPQDVISGCLPPNITTEQKGISDTLIIKDSRLISGTLDKKSLGAGQEKSIFIRSIKGRSGDNLKFIQAVHSVAAAYASFYGHKLSIENLCLGNLYEIIKRRDYDRIGRKYQDTWLDKRWYPQREPADKYFHLLNCTATDSIAEDMVLGFASIQADNELLQHINCGSRGKMSNFMAMTYRMGMTNAGSPMGEQVDERHDIHTRIQDPNIDCADFVPTSYIDGIPAQNMQPCAEQTVMALVDGALGTSRPGQESRIQTVNQDSAIKDVNHVIRKKYIIQYCEPFDIRYYVRVKIDPTVEPLLPDLWNYYWNGIMENVIETRERFVQLPLSAGIDVPFDPDYIFDRVYDGGKSIDKVLARKVLLAYVSHFYTSLISQGYKRVPDTIKMALVPSIVVTINKFSSTKFLTLSTIAYETALQEIIKQLTENVLPAGTSLGPRTNCINEILTQLTLDSKHRIGIGGTTSDPLIPWLHLVGVKSITANKASSLSGKTADEKIRREKSMTITLKKDKDLETFQQKITSKKISDIISENPLIVNSPQSVVASKLDFVKRWVKTKTEDVSAETYRYKIILKLPKEIYKDVYKLSAQDITYALTTEDRIVIYNTSSDSEWHIWLKVTEKNTKKADNPFSIIRATVDDILDTHIIGNPHIYHSVIQDDELECVGFSESIYQMPEVDLNKTVTSALYEFARMFGVHAAVTHLAQLLYLYQNDFGLYHTQIIADEICHRDGKILGFHSSSFNKREPEAVANQLILQGIDGLQDNLMDEVVRPVYGPYVSYYAGTMSKTNTAFHNVWIDLLAVEEIFGQESDNAKVVDHSNDF